MKKANFSKWLIAMLLLLLLVLAACSGGDSDDGAADPDTDTDTEEQGTESEEEEEESDSGDKIYSIEDFSTTKTDMDEPVDGGNLNFGLVSDTVFEGVLNRLFYESGPDADVMQFFDESLLAIDDNYNYTNDGAAEFELEYDDDGAVVTIKIRDNVNWHDGEPVKAEDLAFAYEVIGSPEYTGVRYYYVEDVVGMAEYKAGETDEIEGIEIIDEKTIEISFNEPNPSLLASGLWTSPLPKHLFEDIPIPDMPEHDLVRVNPIGFGPFKVDTIVPGESVTYVKNEDYWQGEPKLDSITLKVIAPETVANALETGEVDVVDSFPTDQYPDVEQKLNNVEFLGKIDEAYTYIGFKLGKWVPDDPDNPDGAGQVEMDPDAKMADVNLRRAMWYAVDNDAVGERFYNGLRWAATTLIIPAFPDYHDPTIETPSYDPDMANQILDEAGYEDVDGDGFRETPDGEELVIGFASMSGGEIAEPIANYYIQAWAEVGLNVELVDGRLMEMNQFYDRVEADDPAIDIYQGAWGTGTDVDQRGLYGRNAAYNYPRYASEENDRLLAEGASAKAMDIEYRKEVYKEWQELMVEEIPVFPTLYRSVLVPVNNRVTGYSIDVSWGEWHEVGVTQEDPILPE